MKLHFICPGSPKCGTTTLYEYLNRHPNITLPSTKETNFFSHNQFYSLGKEWFESEYFKGPEDNINGDISTGYAAYHQIAVPRILADYGQDIKIILMIRNPVKRAYSHYCMIKYGGGKNEPEFEDLVSDLISIHESGSEISLEETMNGYSYTGEDRLMEWRYVQYIKSSMYGEILNSYISAFGIENVMVVSIDDLSRRPVEILDSIQEFIEVDKVSLVSNNLKANESKEIRYKSVSSALSFLYKNKLLRNIIYGALGFSRVNKLYYKIKNLNKKTYVPAKMSSETEARLKSLFLKDVELLEKLTGSNYGFWK